MFLASKKVMAKKSVSGVRFYKKIGLGKLLTYTTDYFAFGLPAMMARLTHAIFAVPSIEISHSVILTRSFVRYE